MFGELIKILSDEPEKIEKVALSGIKLVLNIIIAAHLYKWIVGPFYIFDIDNYASWANYLLSGRVLICLLFYFISDYLIVPLIDILGYGMVYLISKTKPELNRRDFKGILKFFDIVEFQEEKEIPKPGKNIDIMYNLFQTYEDDDTKSEITSLKDTYIGNVLNLYTAFFLIYFTLINSEARSVALNAIVIVGLLLVILFYAGLHWMLEYMQRHHIEILDGLSYIKTNEVIKSTFDFHGVFLEKGTRENKLKRARIFNLNNKEYIVALWPTNRLFFSREVDKFLNDRKMANRIFIIIVKKGFSSNIQELSLKHFGELIIIEYEDDANLKKKLSFTIDELSKTS